MASTEVFCLKPKDQLILCLAQGHNMMVQHDHRAPSILAGTPVKHVSILRKGLNYDVTLKCLPVAVPVDEVKILAVELRYFE